MWEVPAPGHRTVCPGQDSVFSTQFHSLVLNHRTLLLPPFMFFFFFPPQAEVPGGGPSGKEPAYQCKR